jgi:exopolysaccharide biosynthesis polyprenyl glycosylphosphotransferase
MKNNASVTYAFLLLLGDFVALLAAFSIAYVLRVTLDPRPLIAQVGAVEYLKVWVLITPLWLCIFALLGLYKRNVYEYRLREIGALFIGSCLGIMAVITYEFATKANIFPARLVAVYGLSLAFLFLLLERTILRVGRMVMWRYGYGVNNVLLIGDGAIAQNFIKSMRKPELTGYKVVALVTKSGDITFRGKRFETVTEALERLQNLNVNTVLLTGLTSESRVAESVLAAAQANHCAFKFVPTHDGILSNNIEVELFQGLPVVSVHQTALTGWGRIAKRLFDIAASLVGIIILSPVFIIIALLVRISDWGPAIFKQKRLSRFNTSINIYKFRSMSIKYSGLLPEEGFAKMGKPELAIKYRENGDMLPNDPRVTKIGAFLRKTSLDELPQLFNVLKGDISLVGPRALVPRELNNYAFKNLILSVKSGITGLAQTSGRRDIGFEERRALDLYYVQNWSFWLDIKIIFRTIIDVLGGRGAK